MVFFEDNLYVFGGFYESKRQEIKYLDDFYIFNIKTNKWTQDKRKINKPSPRAGFSMWVWQG